MIDNHYFDGIVGNNPGQFRDFARSQQGARLRTADRDDRVKNDVKIDCGGKPLASSKRACGARAARVRPSAVTMECFDCRTGTTTATCVGPPSPAEGTVPLTLELSVRFGRLAVNQPAPPESSPSNICMG